MTGRMAGLLLALVASALGAQGTPAAAGRRVPYAQEWRLEGRAGETMTIDLISDAFDAYLYLLGPAPVPSPPQDDDSGGRCNARLSVRLPAGGRYVIVATSRERRATGAFTLVVTPGSRPAALTPCAR